MNTHASVVQIEDAVNAFAVPAANGGLYLCATFHGWLLGLRYGFALFVSSSPTEEQSEQEVLEWHYSVLNRRAPVVRFHLP